MPNQNVLRSRISDNFGRNFTRISTIFELRTILGAKKISGISEEKKEKRWGKKDDIRRRMRSESREEVGSVNY